MPRNQVCEFGKVQRSKLVSQPCPLPDCTVGARIEFAVLLCPLSSGPELMIFRMTTENMNAGQGASPGRDYRQALRGGGGASAGPHDGGSMSPNRGQRAGLSSVEQGVRRPDGRPGASDEGPGEENARLRLAILDLTADKLILQGGCPGKLPSLARRRRCIDHIRAMMPVSERRLCRVLRQHRSTQRKRAAGRMTRQPSRRIMPQGRTGAASSSAK